MSTDDSSTDPVVGNDDGSFHPLGKEWEDDLEEMLDDTEYNSQLGLEMAKDAMRVTAGELSEAEFHERYHESVLEEFGVDDRPTAEALEELEAKTGGKRSLSDALEAFETDGEMDRREVMKKMGAGAAFLGLGALTMTDDGADRLNAVEAEENEGYGRDNESGTQWGMVLDLERCDGCLSCVQACATENQLDSGVNWMYVMEWEDSTDDMNTGRQRLIRPCQHCSDAPCEKVCPTTARHTRSTDGLVLTDYEVCIGCRYCQVACPYGVNYFQWDEPDVAKEWVDGTENEMDHYTDERGRPVDSRAPRGVMSKCTFCPTRQDGNRGEDRVGSSACEDACPPNAIQFGDMNDPESDPQQYIENVALSRAKASNPDEEELQEAIAVLDGEQEPAEDEEDGMTETQAERLVQCYAGESSSTFRLLEEIGTNPNIVYVGNEPGPNAEQVEGPVAYGSLSYTANDDQEINLVDNRKEVNDEGTIGGDLSP